MRFRRRTLLDTGLSQLNITPLIDCIFLLLIFFMLTSSFIVNPGINIRLPNSTNFEQIDMRTLTITVSSEDIVYVDGKPATISEINSRIKRSKYESIFIRSDKDASFGAVVAIWDICKKNNINTISIATRPGQQND